MNTDSTITANNLVVPPPVDSISRARVDYVHGRIDHDEYERRIAACMNEGQEPRVWDGGAL